jgi:hypothetical protein
MKMSALHRNLALLAPLALGAVLLGAPRPAAAAPAAQAVPVTTDDCKNDGWRRFTDPAFKNQGQCVSSVSHLADGGLPDLDPAATPELGSLVLFGSGAAGFAGYALTRLRAGRGGARPGGRGPAGGS